MRDIRRSLLAGLGALGLALTAVFTAGPAGAAPAGAVPENRDFGQILTMPAAPPASALPAGAAAEPPTAWPKPNKILHVAARESITCESGNLCTATYDPTRGDYVVYYFYYCDTYTLSNWIGTGSYRNSQTGGVTAHFYGQGGGTVTSVGPGGSSNSYNWSPIWSLKNC
ncbi:hypothetical protein ACIF85_12020 [Streptomyces sp. NPDC086033]|uniref:hypothetical protein n=1 Tax=Streptomyces sp. NPDC086033 TaxID=3365747 RepID=UPI0037D776AA